MEMEVKTNALIRQTDEHTAIGTNKESYFGSGSFPFPFEKVCVT
jgi:hypothetical protein